MFWDIRNVLSYNALVNFIVGQRGAGKSYGCKRWCISEFLKKGKQFIWVRRFDSELDDFSTAFFTDIAHEFPDTSFEYKGYKFYVNEQVAGYAIPLSTANKKKSSSYPNVDKIIFDEFIIDKGNSYYLKKEVEILLDLMETVFRMREDIKGVFCLANSISFINPYFLYFNLSRPRNKKKIMCVNDVLIQEYSNTDYIEKKKQTRFGQLIKNTAYGSYSIENEYLRDSEDFITKKKPSKMRYFFTLKAKGESFGVWVGDEYMYVSEKIDPSYKIVYTTILENHEPNTMLLKGANKSTLFKKFCDNFKIGLVRFENLKTKNIVLETIKNTL